LYKVTGFHLYMLAVSRKPPSDFFRLPGFQL
jgi:hypothetical protein